MKINRIAILPSLCTLGNALAGFAAITYTWRALVTSIERTGDALAPHDIILAGVCVLVGMAFDALDGRLARFARATSSFGGQLDSLADGITFGVAPAFLMNRVVVEPLKQAFPAPVQGVLGVTWVCAAVYLACALIRLARFNVENIHDEEAHQAFRGLPSPAAAGALVSVVIVVATCWQNDAYPRLGKVILCVMPLIAMLLGVLMVSNVRYLHLLNYVFCGRQPISYLVRTVLIIALGILVIYYVGLPVGLMLGFGGYVLSGPAIGLVNHFRNPPPAAAPPEQPDGGQKP
jgi:CDP-diacylglycerol--serine O-phosphatidyltransferase